MGGALQLDWRPFTWNQLHHMFMGRQRTEWERTSSIMTMILNVNTEKKHQLEDFDTFNVYRLESGEKKTSEEEARRLLHMAETGKVRSNFSLKNLQI